MTQEATSDYLLATPPDALPEHNVAAFVEELARQHGISSARTRLDDWADKVAELSGDDVRLGATQQLLVNLRRAKIISSDQLVRLHVNHHREQALAASS